MAMWPFRKRRKRGAVGKAGPSEKQKQKPKPVGSGTQQFAGIERRSSVSRHPSKRGPHQRRPSSLKNIPRELSYASSNGPVPDFPLPPSQQLPYPQPVSPMNVAAHFQPQKQQHHGGFSSYFVEHNPSVIATPSVRSLERPRQTNSIIRRLSKRAARDTPSNDSIGRHGSKRRKADRPVSQVSTMNPHAHSRSHSSFSDRSSVRAYKVGSFGVLSPRPALRFDDGTPTSSRFGSTRPGLTPSRSNSRRSKRDSPEWRYKGPAISEERLVNREDRIAEVADELDSHGLRELMERDRRRRDRKKQEEAERLQRRLERRLAQQEPDKNTEFNFEDGAEEPRDIEMGESSRQDDTRIGYAIADIPEPLEERDINGRPRSTMGTQTPLSWLQDNSSAEDVEGKPPRRAPRDVITPISMDSLRDHAMKDTVEAYPNGAVSAEKNSPPRKASVWTSFIKRATQKRIKEEHHVEKQSRGIQVGESTLLTDSEMEPEEDVKQKVAHGSYLGLDVEEMRHKQGQTPGRHLPGDVAVAMRALETGHFDEDERRYRDDDMRDSVLPTPPLLPYQQPESANSSHESLPQPSLSPRPAMSGLTRTPTPQGVLEHPMDSPTIPIIRATSSQSPTYSRPTSQRYSPSLKNRYSGGAASPEIGGSRSVMSTSLASIDSEGSWLSGRMNPARNSLNQVSPLRTSASSLRRRYMDLDDEADVVQDDSFFSGVEPRPQSTDHEMEGGARLDLDEDDDDAASIASDAERNMWRDGTERKVEITTRQRRALSSQGLLSSFEDLEEEERRDRERLTPRRGSDVSDRTERAAQSETTDGSEVFATPMEVSNGSAGSQKDYVGDTFETPAEELTRRDAFGVEMI